MKKLIHVNLLIKRIQAAHLKSQAQVLLLMITNSSKQSMESKCLKKLTAVLRVILTLNTLELVLSQLRDPCLTVYGLICK
jgi:hypothetical protein